MQALAASAKVGLRPHTKTHKSVAIARWQLEAGAAGICCAKLGEAELFADAGITDIRLPYPVNPANAARVAALLKRGVRLSIIVDDLEVARGWSTAMMSAGLKLDVLVKVDVGFHRCGIDPDSPAALSIVKGVVGPRWSDVQGPPESRRTVVQRRIDPGARRRRRKGNRDSAVARGERAKDSGIEVQEISVGSTPTARFITLQTGATEMRPGNYVFFDRTQVGLRATTVDSCALSIVVDGRQPAGAGARRVRCRQQDADVGWRARLRHADRSRPGVFGPRGVVT